MIVVAKMTVLALAAALFGALPAEAAPETLTVTRFDDPPPDGCAPADCSLREATIVSNTDPVDRDSIRLAPGTYVLSIPGSGGFQGDLDLFSSVDILSTGTDEALIDANGAVTGERALEIHDQPPGPVEATLDGVSLTSGVAPVDLDDTARGGAVRVNAGAKLRMEGGRILNSSADRSSPQVGEGGGVWNAGSTFLVDMRLSGNTATGTGSGGAIYTAGGGIQVAYSTIERNEAQFGGAVASNGGSTTLDATRVARNESASSGGAAFIFDGGGLFVENSTLADNTAGGLGGGVRAVNGHASLSSSTVTSNFAPSGGGISVHDVPGGDVGQIFIENTVIGGNTHEPGLDASRPDCETSGSGQILSGGYNLVSASEGCVMPAEGDLIGSFQGHLRPIPPKLRKGASNGGATKTNALKPASPAVDAGDPGGSCAAVDARDLPRSIGGRCDIGAYELARCRGVVATRIGSEFSDRPEGTFAPSGRRNGVLGLDGDDEIAGARKADGLCGNNGDDTLKGRGGDDLLAGGPGHDVCIGGPGKDRAKGCEVERSIP